LPPADAIGHIPYSLFRLSAVKDANLQRAGFHDAYEKEVYEWNA
jgi:hypothetical protein